MWGFRVSGPMTSEVPPQTRGPTIPRALDEEVKSRKLPIRDLQSLKGSGRPWPPHRGIPALGAKRLSRHYSDGTSRVTVADGAACTGPYVLVPVHTLVSSRLAPGPRGAGVSPPTPDPDPPVVTGPPGPLTTRGPKTPDPDVSRHS